MRRTVIGIVIGLMLFVVGCTEKPADVYSELDDAIALNKELLGQLSGLMETDKELNTRLAELVKSDYSNILCRLSALETDASLATSMRMRSRAMIDNIPKPKPYDPNAPQYAFLEVAEPNWVAAYGDTLETRMVYNISKNRVMNAMLGKRLLALENPVETEQSAEEALEEAITPCEEPKKEVVDQNEVKQ